MTKKPPTGYVLIAFTSLFFAVGLIIYFFTSDKVIGSRLYYILLVILSISIAIFTFGVLKSTASLTYEEKLYGYKLELTGPIVVFVLVVVGGFYLTNEPAEETLVVKFHGPEGINHVVVERGEAAILISGQEAEIPAPIILGGIARFTSIASKYFKSDSFSIRMLEFDNQLELTNPNNFYLLKSDETVYVELIEVCDSVKFIFEIRDYHTDLPLDSVKIVSNDLNIDSWTNANGRFETNICTKGIDTYKVILYRKNYKMIEPGGFLFPIFTSRPPLYMRM